MLDGILQGVQRVIDKFSQSPEACLLLGSVFAIVSVAGLRMIVGGLMEMHRSKTALEKLRKGYTFRDKLLMKHAWEDCLHAKGFCRALIVCHHIRVLLLLGTLILTLSAIWLPNLLPAAGYAAGVLFLIMDVPIMVMETILDKYSFHRRKHEYRFKKYHNTKDHSSLM